MEVSLTQAGQLYTALYAEMGFSHLVARFLGLSGMPWHFSSALSAWASGKVASSHSDASSRIEQASGLQLSIPQLQRPTVLDTFTTSGLDYTQFCPEADICYRLSLPPSTRVTGNGDVFFQINSLVSYSWVGLGLGHQMAGAKIFIMYAVGNTSITVSPRLGLGPYEPRYDSDSQFEVLEGSGVFGYRMTANIRCRDCGQWVGGGMDWTQPDGLFIWAARPGLPLDSSNPKQNLQIHQQHGVFQWDFAPATIQSSSNSSNTNPFLTAPPADVTIGVRGGLPAVPIHYNPSDGVPVAHGTIMSFAFLVLFPAGAILIKATSHRRMVRIHACIQVGTYIAILMGMGIGIHMASTGHLFTSKHPQIGLALVVVLFFQAADGLIHHAQYVRHHRKRTKLALVHMWMGRILIFLGMMNGGFGLQLARVTDPGKIAGYSVVAVVSATCLVTAIIYGEKKRKRVLLGEKIAREERQRREEVSTFE